MPGARMTTVRAQGRSCVYGVKKSLGINKIIPKHLKQMFHYSMEECGSAAGEVQCILQGMTFDASDDDVMMEMSVYGS